MVNRDHCTISNTTLIYIGIDVGIRMFIAAFFIIGKTLETI